MTTTRIAFLLDRTGSMASIREDVIGGYNTFLAEQRDLEEDECPYSITQFDTSGFDTEQYTDIRDAPALSLDTYVPRAGTNLLDAVARVIGVTEQMPDAGRTLVVVYTDGEENASRETTKEQLKTLVESKRALGWDFVFIGADIDAFAEAGQFGFDGSQSYSTLKADTAGTWSSVTSSISAYRGNQDYQEAMSSLRKSSKANT